MLVFMRHEEKLARDVYLYLDAFLKVLDTSADSSAAAMSATQRERHKGP